MATFIPITALSGMDGQVNGIIDFGDIVHGPLILDLANAVGDFLSAATDLDETIFDFVRGYAVSRRWKRQRRMRCST